MFLHQKSCATISTYFYDVAVWNSGTYLIGGGSGNYGKLIAVIDENSNGISESQII